MLCHNNSNIMSNANLVVNRGLYRNQTNQVHIQSSYKTNLDGHNSTFNITQSLLSAFGEYIERFNIIMPNANINEEVQGFNLINGEVVSIPKSSVYFTEKEFNDSCGIASYINSKKAIKNAFFEFIERQSFIEHCIFKIPGIKIENEYIRKNHSKNLSFLKNYVDYITFYNISIFEDIPVILGIGVGGKNKTIGLSANESFDAAIEDTMKEMGQTFSKAKTKYEMKNNEYISSSSGNSDLYSATYFNTSPKEFSKYYKFLNTGETYNGIPYIPPKDFNSLVKKFSGKYGMNILCVKIKNTFNPITRIVKILSPNSYPYMLPNKNNDIFKKPIYHENVNTAPDFNIIPFP